MAMRSRLCGSMPLGILLLACAGTDSLGNGGGGGSGGGGESPTLAPMEFDASVNATPPAGYTIASDEQPYSWQAYVRYGDAWIAEGSPQHSAAPAAHLVIDCNDPAMHDACTLHLPGLIQVTVTDVSPSPARLCAYKSGFLWRADLLLNTPAGSLVLAPVASSSQDPANQGACYP
ncbi:MAG TPA: hypothetical protein VEI47_04665 [Gemmatimonadales bacterium]|nr:hypothetical protein [Gemmatimonadales bacterium]